MNKKKSFLVVNSFSINNYGGNPAAIFSDAEGITDREMQEIAKQLNLVETVFVLPALEDHIDFHFRYFTPTEEVPLAGHPTIAAFVALVEEKRLTLHTKDRFFIKTLKGVQEITVTKDGEELVFRMKFPDPQFLSPKIDSKEVVDILELSEEDLIPNLPIEAVDTGLGHLIIPVKSLNALMEIKRKIKPLKELCCQLGVREIQAFTFETKGNDVDIHTRNICPREGIEDPACGAGNSAVGSYLLKNYYLNEEIINIRAEQGYIVGMPSRVDIEASRNGTEIEVYVGGTGRVVIEGNYII